MNLQTKTFLLSALVGLTFSTTSSANLINSASNNDIELNIHLEIEQNLQAIMTEIQAPSINSVVVKQLQQGYLQHQTDQLVKNAGDALPSYKINMVLTE
jgi:hypothetical protein